MGKMSQCQNERPYFRFKEPEMTIFMTSLVPS